MGKVKIKKKAIWIDMTPMSDVMVLLLTFFMLTSTFVKNEPVKVNTPGSVSEIKVPEKNVLNILVDKKGKIFLGMDNPEDMQEVISSVAQKYGVSLSDAQLKNSRTAVGIGVDVSELPQFLSLKSADFNAYQATKGIPTDSVAEGDKKSQFQNWVSAVRELPNGADTKLAIKADADTPYKVVKKVMSELQDMNENRYYLITSYKKVED